MKIINDLKQFKKEDYCNFKNEVVAELEAIDFVRSIYQFGTVRHPGISDLDLLIIFADDVDYVTARNQIYNLIMSFENASYLIFHSPIFISVQDVKYAKIFHTMENLKCLYGHEFDFSDKTEFNNILSNYWNLYFYQVFLELFAKKQSSKRFFLLVINNVTKTLQYNDLYLGTDLSARLFVTVEELREKCMKDIDSDISLEAEHLLMEAYRVMCEHEGALNKHISHELCVVCDLLNRKIFIASNKIKIINFKFLKIFLLPVRFFLFRKEYSRIIKKECKGNGLSKKEFLKIRQRVGAMKFLGL